MCNNLIRKWKWNAKRNCYIKTQKSQETEGQFSPCYQFTAIPCDSCRKINWHFLCLMCHIITEHKVVMCKKIKPQNFHRFTLRTRRVSSMSNSDFFYETKGLRVKDGEWRMKVEWWRVKDEWMMEVKWGRIFE